MLYTTFLIRGYRGVDYLEMHRIAMDAEAVRRAAQLILATLGESVRDSERQFLEDLLEFEGPLPLSMRRREWLYALLSRAKRRSVVKGYRASTLIKRLWELRFDLSEEAEAFVEEQYQRLKEHGANLMLSIPQWRYVFKLCHQVGEIEPYVAID
jgi:hypothetical protein